MSWKKRRGFKELTFVDDALRSYLSLFDPISEYEDISVYDAIGRVLPHDILSPIDLPPFDRSAVDGYAVRSMDLSGASEGSPVRLKVIGLSTTSAPFEGRIDEGEAVRIDTGARMPEGADAVVMLEFTDRKGEFIEVFKPVSPMENVSVKGEDIRKGEIIVYGGIPLTPYDIANLVNIGMYRVKVIRKIKVGIVAIGSELLEYSDDLPLGKIRETNRVMIKSLLKDFPIEFKDYGILPDDHNIVREVILRGVSENDLMISIGGSSLGEGDVVTDIAEELGEIVVHGVALYPSRPVLLSRVDNKPYIGVPGYPVAAAISTKVFIQPLILHLSSIQGTYIECIVRGRLTRRVASKIGLRHYVRVKVKMGDEILIEPVYASGAGVLSSLSLGDGYLVIPEDVEGYDKGDYVDVILYRKIIR